MSEDVEVRKGQPKKAALGRGLGTLLGSNSFSSQVQATVEKPEEKVELKGRVLSLDVDQIYPNPNQPRKVFSEEELEQLSQSIRVQGVLQPIIVRKRATAGYEIIAGERRWRASQRAGLHQVPAILKEVGDQNAQELALIENIQRQNLNPIEEAHAYQFLIEQYKLTQQELSERVGKERATVANVMRLLQLQNDVKQWVASGEISAGHAKILVSVEDPKQQKQLAERVRNEKLSVRALEQLLKPKAVSTEVAVSKKPAVPSAHIDHLIAEMQKTTGTKTRIEYGEGKGYLQLYFYSDEQLNDMVDRIQKAWRNI